MGCGASKSATAGVTEPGRVGPRPCPRQMPGQLGKAVCGMWSPKLAAGREVLATMAAVPEENRRDFARVIYANKPNLFVLTRASRGGPQPLMLSSGPASSHVGDLGPEVLEKAVVLFKELLGKAFAPLGEQAEAQVSGQKDALVAELVSRISVNSVLDFVLEMGLLPCLLQPLFLVCVTDKPKLSVRIVQYGFVAGAQSDVVGDRPEEKRTPFCVRLVSPDLAAVADGNGSASGSSSRSPSSSWSYFARHVSVTSVVQAMTEDVSLLRRILQSGDWAPLMDVVAQMPGFDASQQPSSGPNGVVAQVAPAAGGAGAGG